MLARIHLDLYRATFNIYNEISCGYLLLKTPNPLCEGMMVLHPYIEMLQELEQDQKLGTPYWQDMLDG